jgi:hypothetical protein
MAYPSISGAYGLIPVNLVGGRVEAGSTRMIPIASGYNQNINFGDLVQLASDGTLIKSAIASVGGTQSTPTGGFIGVFLGCEYSVVGGGSVIQGKNRYQNWRLNTSTSDAVAYVCDDPQQVFKAAAVVNNGTVTSTSLAAFGSIYLGSLLEYVPNYSSTAPLNGNSTAGLCAGTSNAPVTATAPFRIVQLVPDTAVTTVTTVSATVTSATQTLTSTTGIYPGMLISGTGVSTGTYVQSVTSTQIVASAPITGTAGNSITFVGYPEVLVTWNFGSHAYMQNAGRQ